MSLATIIRLEFAYPGVGVLAGDSLQYLSIATAHGVIMVFFMIMPAIYGAFGNFLLPTQLGVHDVAFPRLNSAAFWFLPGGLIMLCQLVCTDRRYQRMNCFNIREVQGILKRKFFTDLVNTNEHKMFLNNTMLGLRYKTNNTESINTNMSSFFNYGTTTSDKFKILNFESIMLDKLTGRNMFKNFKFDILDMNQLGLSFKNLLGFILNIVFFWTKDLANVLLNLNIVLSSLLNLNIGIIFNSLHLPYLSSNIDTKLTRTSVSSESNVYFTTDLHNKNSAEFNNLFKTTEFVSSFRYLRFFNPIISYDYKYGNYLGI